MRERKLPHGEPCCYRGRAQEETLGTVTFWVVADALLEVDWGSWTSCFNGLKTIRSANETLDNIDAEMTKAAIAIRMT